MTACPETKDSACHTAWIDLVLARALELRKAGVLAIGMDGLSVSLAPYIEPLADEKPTGDALPEFTGGVMGDPASYADGVVPGYEITKFSTEFEE